MSRSSTVVVAYLMTATSMGWHDALRYVKSMRPVVNPNLGFQRQLMNFEQSGQRDQVDFIISTLASSISVNETLELNLNL